MKLSICLSGILLILLSFVEPTFASKCKYYAFVDYGKTAYGDDKSNLHKVYRSSGLRKYKKGFKAVYTLYDQKGIANNFKLKNIGPYDGEAVAYDALKSFVEKLENDGYVEKGYLHIMPAIQLKKAIKCK